MGDARCLPLSAFSEHCQYCQCSHPRFLNPLNIQRELRHHSRVFNHYPSLGLNGGNQQEKKNSSLRRGQVWAAAGAEAGVGAGEGTLIHLQKTTLHPRSSFQKDCSVSARPHHLPPSPTSHKSQEEPVECEGAPAFWMNSWVNTQTWSHSCHVSFKGVSIKKFSTPFKEKVF